MSHDLSLGGTVYAQYVNLSHSVKYIVTIIKIYVNCLNGEMFWFLHTM